ncbi:hypothetical protein COLO4_30505 [Corchorus olitorius]|uniref:AAA+ ATPase domain-containing protein n=1 Tax=Corchorus olitorius TaxID=93759 RepID=A0A1R3H8D6_9ROSI|nr:hypothetical protein COLO4_30505 [Corchorus olitorius]
MDGMKKASHESSSSIKGSLSTSMEDGFETSGGMNAAESRNRIQAEEDEEALRWAAIEKLPSFHRLRTSIINSFVENDDNDQSHGIGNRRKIAPREVDVRKLGIDDRQNFINALFKVADEDNEKFLKRFRNRVDKVGIQLPTVEVRFEHLTIEAHTYVGSRALPTLPNVVQNIAESTLALVGVRFAKKTKINILNNVSGIIKPSRMTLLLGPPGSGKTTLLRALAGKLDPSLKATAIEGAESSLATDYILKVTSKKDQAQYWVDKREPYRYISVSEFANKFKKFHVGVQLLNELSVPFDKSQSHKAALVFTKYSIPKLELLKACWDKEVLLMKRNAVFYVFKTSQITILAFLGSTIFPRTRMHHRNEQDAMVYYGAILFSIVTNMFNGYPEVALVITRLPVFFKQRDLLLYPAWAFAIPLLVTKIPIAIFETIAWMAMTYYSIGFAPEVDRFFKNMLVVLLMHQAAASLFRLISGVCRTMVVSNTAGMCALLFFVLVGGVTLTRTEIPPWWKWGYWCSPLSYIFNALAINEFYAPRWMNKLASDNVTKLGEAVLASLDIYRNKNMYWISVGALLVFSILCNVLFTLALTYLNSPSSPQAVLPEDSADEMKINIEMTVQGINSQSTSNSRNKNSNSTGEVAKNGMVLPFAPLTMSFNNVNYYVDMPPVSHNFASSLTLSKATELTMITGAMYVAVMFLGVNNSQTAQPVVAIERSIFYRERAAGMYSALPYAFAQVIVELPYVLIQSSYYTVIVFAMIQFKWTFWLASQYSLPLCLPYASRY